MPHANVAIIKNYIDAYKKSPYRVKYVFVDANGNECCSKQSSNKSYVAYALDITSKPPVKLIFSSEINKLFKENFTINIDQESIIETTHGDFLIISMSRPHEYNPKSIRCAAGMGEDRTYLASIKNGNLTILNRKFLGCAASYKVIRNDSDIGYEVTQFSDNPDNAPKTRYIIKNGKLIKQK